jgi:hypothetical protein|tara:strand:+ start:354 stop:506 length:153 start_codon:yes stop_codon:yes gene_type:complete
MDKGDDNQTDLQKVIEQNKDLLHQIKFWQELYLKSISQEKLNTKESRGQK